MSPGRDRRIPSGNPRAPDTLSDWLDWIDEARAEKVSRNKRFAPFCVNLLASSAVDPCERSVQLEACCKARVPLIRTNLGDPREEGAAVHEWGGLVFHYVTTLRHAEKAIDAGVDGLMLVTAGAGGHAGTLNPFAFLPRVREKCSTGFILLAGGIADGAGVSAALTLSADLAVMGTRFIASRESGAAPEHKAMLADAEAEDVMFTDAIAGMSTSFLKSSMVRAGLDPHNLPPPLSLHRPGLPPGIKAWKQVWSGGHSTALIRDAPSVEDLVTRLEDEFAPADRPSDWPRKLERSA